MTVSILSSLLASPVFIATNEVSGTTVWSKLGIESVEVETSSANTDSPVSNVQISDSGTAQSLTEQDIQSIKILQPSRLRVTAYCDDISTVENVIATFLNDTVTMAITTKSIITQSLVMTDLELEQTPEMISASKLTMMFEQVQPSTATGYAPEQDADSSVYSISITTPLTVTPLATMTKAVVNAAISSATQVSGALIDAAGNAFTLDHSKLS